MRKIIFAHLFLNLYLLALIQPAFPIIEYFANYNYIVSHLCENRDKPILTCNGKCYLEKQVKKQLGLDHSQEMPKPPKIDLEKFISLKTKKFTYHFFEKTENRFKPIYTNSLHENTHVFSLLRPPIF